MIRFLAARLAASALTLFLAATLTFILIRNAPGDHLTGLELSNRVSSETLAGLRRAHGLDATWHHHYFTWLGDLSQGRIGHSVSYNIPVSQLLLPRARNTLALSITAMLLSWFAAVPLAMFCAWRSRNVVARLCDLLIAAVQSLPDLILASLVLVAALSLGLLFQAAQGLLIPSLTLAAGSLPAVFRHARAAMLQTQSAPFVHAARALGVPESRIWFRHILPAAANPLITLAGLSIAGLLSSAAIVEIVFGLPGLGPLVIEAIGARDLLLVTGSVMLSAALLTLGNLAADVALAIADPRVRLQ